MKRPENCPQVVAPPVNPVIWRELDKFQRTRDVHLQTAQELLVKGLLTAVQVKEKLMEASKSSSDPLFLIFSQKSPVICKIQFGFPVLDFLSKKSGDLRIRMKKSVFRRASELD